MSSFKKNTSQHPRKAAAKKVQPGSPGEFGRLTKQELTPLLLQAKEAFDHQKQLGKVEPGETFDTWRRDTVSDAVQLAGLSKINRSHWRKVMAEFLTLSGREDEAFKLLTKTGTKSYRPTSQEDTWESSEIIVAHILTALDAHSKIAVTHPKGHIAAGWLLHAARQRTGKPDLTLQNLAERLDQKTLTGLLSHLANHISTREVRADPSQRSPRIYPQTPDPGSMIEDDDDSKNPF